MSQNHRRYFRNIMAFALALTMLVGGVAFALAQSTEGITISAEDYELLMQYKHLEQMRRIILENYYEEVDEADLFTGAAQGMFYSLGDPYSFYYTKESMEKFHETANGEYAGVGIQILANPNDYSLTIVRVFKNSPAEAVGIRAGDKIVQVDDLEVTAYEINDAVSIMKGDVPGTTVDIAVMRGTERLEFTVPRAKILVNNVDYRMLENQIGYIQLFSFEAAIVNEYEKALADLRSQGMQGLILDLRDNPGGNVEYAERIASTILGDELIYYTKDRYGLRVDKYADGEVMEEPLVLLCNANSASASEIILGAVQAHGAGTIVGTTSFGKGIIQSVLTFPEGDGMQVTSAQYFTPDDKTIHGVGVKPDVEIELDEDAYDDGAQILPEKDNQLATAIEVVMEKLQADKAA